MRKYTARWELAFYDLLILFVVDLLLLVFYQGNEPLPLNSILIHAAAGCVLIFAARVLGEIYRQIWRYGGIQCYIRLLITDAAAFVGIFAFEMCLRLFTSVKQITFSRLLSISCMNLLGALAIRMIYRYCFKCGTADTKFGKFLRLLLWIFAGDGLIHMGSEAEHKIKIAIIGAGRVGVTLAEELFANPAAAYIPRCFIDVSTEKAGRSIHGIPVLLEDETTLETLRRHEVQEVVGCRDNRTNRRMTLNLGSL